MNRQEELILSALEKEHKRLTTKADNAKFAAKEHLNVGTELGSIRRRGIELINEGKSNSPELKTLVTRLKKGASKLFDQEFETENDADLIHQAIQSFKWSKKL